MAEPEYINLKTLSNRLGVGARTTRSWISEPDLKLPAYKVKGLLLFNWAEVEQWVQSYRVAVVDVDAAVDELLSDFTKGKNNERK